MGDQDFKPDYWDELVDLIRKHFPGALALRVTTFLPDGETAVDFEDFRPTSEVHVTTDGEEWTEVPLPFSQN